MTSAAESRRPQGLPPHVEDQAVLRRLALLFASERDEAPPKRGSTDTTTTIARKSRCLDGNA